MSRTRSTVLHSISRVNPADGDICHFSDGLTGAPNKIIAASDGKLYFTISDDPAAIGRIKTDGTIKEFRTGLDERRVPRRAGRGRRPRPVVHRERQPRADRAHGEPQPRLHRVRRRHAGPRPPRRRRPRRHHARPRRQRVVHRERARRPHRAPVRAARRRPRAGPEGAADRPPHGHRRRAERHGHAELAGDLADRRVRPRHELRQAVGPGRRRRLERRRPGHRDDPALAAGELPRLRPPGRHQRGRHRRLRSRRAVDRRGGPPARLRAERGRDAGDPRPDAARRPRATPRRRTPTATATTTSSTPPTCPSRRRCSASPSSSSRRAAR